MRKYTIRAERDGWQILHGVVVAASEASAKRKFRRKYKRAVRLCVEAVEK